MTNVIIDLTMSLDGYIAGPDDGAKHPLGLRGGAHLFDWYQGGGEPIHGDDRFRPVGINRDVVEAMFRDTGAMIFGRRTYDLTHGWDGTHPVAGPVFILTHRPPSNVPKGRSTFSFVTDGIAAAVKAAKAAAGNRPVRIGGASAANQALAAGLADELWLHVAPLILGDGVKLFDQLGASAIKLEQTEAVLGDSATHLRYRVVGKQA
jgi:dihydrofolate reductase